MNLIWAVVVLVVVNAATIAAMLAVRRRAPEGSYFSDGDRASGVFGVLAGGFAIFAGFVIFLAFTNYDQSRAGAEAEALTVVQQFETAEFLPRRGERAACRARSSATARSVVHQEWPEMEDGTRGDTINPWSRRAVPEPEARGAGRRHRGGGVREVARPDLGPRGGAARPAARRGGHHPGARSGSSCS